MYKGLHRKVTLGRQYFYRDKTVASSKKDKKIQLARDQYFSLYKGKIKKFEFSLSDN